MAVFQGKFLDYINKAIEKNMITLPENMTIQKQYNNKLSEGRTRRTFSELIVVYQDKE